MNPNLDPRVVGPVVAAGNWVVAWWCVGLSACLWVPGAVTRVLRSSEDAG